MNCSPPGSSVHGISQARLLEWIAISFSRGSSWPKGRTWLGLLYCWLILYCLSHQGHNIRSGPWCWPPSNTTSVARVCKTLCAITTAWFQETSKRISKKINISKGEEVVTLHLNEAAVPISLKSPATLWLIHVEVWQKTTKFCKTIILQLKNK